jgi:hypothetical protein
MMMMMMMMMNLTVYENETKHCLCLYEGGENMLEEGDVFI